MSHKQTRTFCFPIDVYPELHVQVKLTNKGLIIDVWSDEAGKFISGRAYSWDDIGLKLVPRDYARQVADRYGSSVVYVQSHTDSLLTYRVDAKTGFCTCPDYTIRNIGEGNPEHRCKHYKGLLDDVGMFDRVLFHKQHVRSDTRG